MHKVKRKLHPVYYLSWYVSNLNIGLEDFLKKSGMTEDQLRSIARGEERITEETATKIAKVTGLCAECWLKWQKEYDESEEVLVNDAK